MTDSSGIAVSSGKATPNDILNDLKNYSFYNADTSKVINSKVFSSYNGTPVIRHDLFDSSMSISNTIFLRNGVENDTDGINELKHEWGHTVQESLIGSRQYFTKIAIPSVIGNKLGVEPYFSQPWERSADYFGGANNGLYVGSSEVMAGIYF